MRCILLLWIICTIQSCTTSPDPPDNTVLIIKWSQPDPQPSYWELKIESAKCGQINIQKFYKTNEIEFTFVPDIEFPDYTSLIIICRAVKESNDTRSEWSVPLIIKRDSL